MLRSGSIRLKALYRSQYNFSLGHKPTFMTHVILYISLYALYVSHVSYVSYLSVVHSCVERLSTQSIPNLDHWVDYDRELHRLLTWLRGGWVRSGALVFSRHA
jgi:hypothetical protein